MKLLVGADPELFLKEGKNFVSAHGVVPGTKKDPWNVINGAVQVDGMALEFNITPAETCDQFVHNINDVMKQLRSMVPEKYDFTDTVTATFAPEYLAKQPPEALALGCDPDYDAYSEKVSDRKIQPGNKRAAGGHVHLGWTEGADVNDYSHFLSCCQLAKQLDFFLGLPSVLLDKDVQRRKQYGFAGAFRPKPYGMEYRTLSNFWIHNPLYTRFVFEQTVRAFNLFVDDDVELVLKHGNFAKDAIMYVFRYGRPVNDAISFAKDRLFRVPIVLEGSVLSHLQPATLPNDW